MRSIRAFIGASFAFIGIVFIAIGMFIGTSEREWLDH